MFFTKKDRETIHRIHRELDFVVTQLKHMATRRQMDEALARNEKDVEEAIARHEQAMKDALTAQQDAINNLQSKVDAGEDFSAEVAELDATHQRLQALAATPISAIINPPTGGETSHAGAAGTVVPGAAGEAAAQAAGGEPIKDQGDHPGNTPAPHEPDGKPQEDAAPEGAKLEWGTGEHEGQVRDLPDGDWRTPTEDEKNGHVA